MISNGDKVPVNNCTNCKFHDYLPMSTPDGQIIVGQQQMICRRKPPVVISVTIPTPEGAKVSAIPTFPGVNESIWCYEYEPENGAQDALPDGNDSDG